MQKMKGSILRFHSFSTHLQKLGADSVGQISAFSGNENQKSSRTVLFKRDFRDKKAYPQQLILRRFILKSDSQ